jgi:tRNA A-37 threonylcarbamoyl transferase component Bud32
MGTLDPREFLDCEVRVFLRRTQGRETFHTGPLPGLPPGCIVKRTHGAPRGESWYTRLSDRRSAGQREHQNLVALRADGILVPEAIAWCEERPIAGPVRSAVIMEHVVHAETLREALARADQRERARLCAALLAIVARLHARGWYHRDLYLQHFVVRASDGALVLIDVGRARREDRPRARWLVKDLAALLHSTPSAVTDRERLGFLARWMSAMRITARGARRSFLRAVIRKRARMAAHVPRDEREPAENA